MFWVLAPAFAVVLILMILALSRARTSGTTTNTTAPKLGLILPVKVKPGLFSAKADLINSIEIDVHESEGDGGYTYTVDADSIPEGVSVAERVSLVRTFVVRSDRRGTFTINLKSVQARPDGEEYVTPYQVTFV